MSVSCWTPQNPSYFLRCLFLSILRTKCGKNQLATPGNCLPSMLPTQPWQSSLLKENLADVCLSHTVTSWEWDWPRYRMAEVVQGEWVAVSATTVATRKFQEKLPGQQGEAHLVIIYLYHGYRKSLLYVQQPRKQQSVGWSSSYGMFKS